MEDTFKIGRIGKPHGIKGEVQMQFSDDVFDRTDADYVFLVIDGLPVPFFFEEYRFRSDDLAIVKFEGIDSSEQAREITGCDVLFPRSLSDSDSDELSWAEITGFTVIDNSTEKPIGVIKSVDDSTMNVLLSVENDKGEEILIPVSDELIEDINKDNKTITMDIPEGLLSL